MCIRLFLFKLILMGGSSSNRQKKDDFNSIEIQAQGNNLILGKKAIEWDNIKEWIKKGKRIHMITQLEVSQNIYKIKDLQCLPNLKTLILSKCCLVSIEGIQCNNLINLTYLSLSQNHISSLKSLRKLNLRNLYQLWVDNNMNTDMNEISQINAGNLTWFSIKWVRFPLVNSSDWTMKLQTNSLINCGMSNDINHHLMNYMRSQKYLQFNYQ